MTTQPSPRPCAYAGYIASRKNAVSGGWNVLVAAERAGLDTAGGPYVTLCDVHGNLVNHTTKRTALRFLPYAANWCENCRE